MALTVADFLQTKSYSAAAMRRVLLDADVQPGVVGSTDLKVVQRAAGANLSVDVGAGSGWVQGGFVARQGLYHAYNDAVVNLSIGANAIANPRVDSVVLRLYDTTDGGSGQDIAAVEVWQGTATASAQITAPLSANYRAGALATPAGASFIRLCDILVPASSPASITNAMIVDRRPWARGASYAAARTSGNITGLGSVVDLDTSVLQVTLETLGNPVQLMAQANGYVTGAPASLILRGVVDGTAVTESRFTMATAAYSTSCSLAYTATLAAGRHTLKLTGGTTDPTTANFYSTTGLPITFSVRELLAVSVQQ